MRSAGFFFFFFFTFQFLKSCSSHFFTSIFHRVIKYKCQFPNTAARPRKRPPPPCQRRLFSSSCLLLNSHLLNVVSLQTKEEGRAKRVDGLIPLMPRWRLKSFVSHKQTSRREKLPPPTFPAATLQQLNPSVGLQLSLCISLRRHFMFDAPGLELFRKKNQYFMLLFKFKCMQARVS